MLSAPGATAIVRNRRRSGGLTPPISCSTGPKQRSLAGLSASPRPLPAGNELLASLPAEDLQRLLPSLERVGLKRRQVLQERNLPLSYAYFLESGLVSQLVRTGGAGQAAMEVATLGCKDLVGLPLVLGTGRAPHRCVVQIPGEALRIDADSLRQAMADLPSLRELLLAYVQGALVQSAQLAVCNARHSLSERVARWLLVAQDRLQHDDIPLTHQGLGRALGVRRAGVTTAIGRMEESGLLRRGRGQLAIQDRAGLERAACDCYRTLRAEAQRFCTTGASHTLHARPLDGATPPTGHPRAEVIRVPSCERVVADAA